MRTATIRRLAIPAVLVAAVVLVQFSKPERPHAPAVEPPALAASHASRAVPAGLPRLVDLGADSCIPCKAMAPILVELRTEYAGRLQVDFIDVWKNPGAADPYRIYAIPTQVFFDGRGKELARHEGFLSKDDILATWRRLGYDLNPATPRS
jgi:thioredoxin 1